MLTIQQYPFVNTWLTVKLFALLAYIMVGSIAIKQGKSAVIRFWASIIALAIIGVAKAHHALSWFAVT